MHVKIHTLHCFTTTSQHVANNTLKRRIISTGVNKAITLTGSRHHRIWYPQYIGVCSQSGRYRFPEGSGKMWWGGEVPEGGGGRQDERRMLSAFLRH